MYVFDVYYKVNGKEHKKSWLLAWPEEGFQMKNEVQEILNEEYKESVTVIETDLEEF
ncbi:hypothetical protein [Bacillus sp. FSL K6-2944]|uniref:hypothetical protein n=1 Tax=Bacillus sp. FSL K6-2944 TaxID=2921486 RepID=UPI0030F55FC4